MSLLEKESMNNKAELGDNVVGFPGFTDVRERSNMVRIGKDRVTVPVENFTPSSRFIDVVSGLEKSEVKDVLDKLKTAGGIDETKLDEMIDLDNKVKEEVKLWVYMINFIREHQDEMRVIDETKEISFDELDSPAGNTMGVNKYFSQNNIPVTGVEKYFLTSYKDVNKFYDLKQYNFDVNPIRNDVVDGQNLIGVELVMRNHSGSEKKFVFIFADPVADEDKEIPKDKEAVVVNLADYKSKKTKENQTNNDEETSAVSSKAA